MSSFVKMPRSSDVLTNECILKMTRPDLMNECERQGLSSSGTAEELRVALRNHLGQIDLDSHEAAVGDVAESLTDTQVGGDQAPVENVRPKSSSSDVAVTSDLLKLMTWMNEQNEQRFERLLALQQNQLLALSARLSPRNSSRGSDSGVTPYSLRRSVSRLSSEAQIAVDRIHAELIEKKEKQFISASLSNVQRLKKRLEKLLDDKMDVLEGDEEKDRLLKCVYDLQDKLSEVSVKAEVHLAKIEKEEREKAKAGPLPPNVDIPTFDGNEINYPSWWDHFRVLVHENRDVSDFWKMQYLLKALVGNAAAVLAGKQGLAEEYIGSIQAVQARYGSEHMIVRHLVNSIVGSTPPSLKDLSSFGKFIELMKTNLVSLDMYNATKDMIILPLLEAKLPASIRKAWERVVYSLIDKGTTPTSSDFLKFCESEFDALNSITSNNGASKQEVPKKHKIKSEASRQITAQSLIAGPSGTLSANQARQKEKVTCLICDKPHGTKRCWKFAAKSKEDRRKLITENKHCFKCLDVKFSSLHRCAYKKCSECKAPHHELLSCPERTSIPVDESNTTEATKGLIVVSNEGAEVMPTVLAKAVVGNSAIPVRLALDSMSQKTFITSSAVRKLGLTPIFDRTICVQGFGGMASKERVGSVEIKLLPLDRNYTTRDDITIGAYVKDGPICAPMNAVHIDLSRHPHLRGLKLSDPHIPEGAEIDILIGQAPFQQIVSGEVIKPTSSDHSRQPSAWKTIFGYALMGPLPKDQLNSSSNPCLFAVTKSETVDSRDYISEKNSNEKAFISTNSTDESILERFWKFDAMGIIDEDTKTTPEEDRAWQILRESIQYDGERYSVALPFKENVPKLENNIIHEFRDS